MSAFFLSLGSLLPFWALCLTGWWIGRFYYLKFGEAPQSWLFPLGAVLGSAGRLILNFPPWGEVLLVLGALCVAGAAFRLWYLLMGTRS